MLEKMIQKSPLNHQCIYLFNNWKKCSVFNANTQKTDNKAYHSKPIKTKSIKSVLVLLLGFFSCNFYDSKHEDTKNLSKQLDPKTKKKKTEVNIPSFKILIYQCSISSSTKPIFDKI